ncbi:MAG: phosphatidylinositol-specific phospholipase C1-like protein, partial [Candidatus Methylomirabilis sp.]|nr:phosphatidylinositol-specific phospholipase C1-like protein [Deltaproteobacteria bacterium]
MTPFRVRSLFSFAALLAAVGCGGGGGNGAPADAAKSLDERVRVNQIQVRGTHNSYHVQPAIPFDASHCYTHAPLDVQLEDQGVRAFELDVHWSAGAGEVEVYHLGLIDQQTTCKRLRDCLGTIDAWSDGRPTHLPIFVWIEVKDQYGGQRFANLDPVDAAFRDAFGAKLLTPDEVQGDAPTLREAIETRGWPTLAEARG